MYAQFIKMRFTRKTGKFFLAAVFVAMILTVLLRDYSAARSGGASASIASNGGTKRVLVLCSYGYTLPAYARINPALVTELESAGLSPNDIFFEYLDLMHLPDGGQRRALAEALQRKYAPLGIDLIICLHRPAIYFLLNAAAGLFADVPVIAWSARVTFDKLAEKPGILSMAGNMDVNGTLRHALELFPRTRQVVFVIGASQVDQSILDEARRAFADWESQLVIEDTAADSVEEMLDRVTRLPSDSIVIFGNFFKDRTGRTFTPRDVGRKVAETAHVPVFALYDTLLDQGIVGGALLSFAAEGTRIGQRALDLLEGRMDASAYSSVLVGDALPMFDWQQIKRWSGRAANLLPDSIFINRTPSLWRRYWWTIVGTGGFVMAQFLLISALLIQQRRSTRAEQSLQIALAKAEEGDQMLSALMEYVPEGIAIGDSDLQLKKVSRHGLDLLGGSHQGKSVGEVVAQWKVYHADGQTPMADEELPLVRAVRHGEIVRNVELVQVNISGRKVPLLCNAAPIRDLSGHIVGGIVAWRDITELTHAEEALREREQILQLFIRHAPAALAMFDNEMRYLSASHRWLTDYGLDGKDIIGRSHYEIFPEIPERWKAVHRRGLAGEVMEIEEDPFARLDGTVQWLHWVVHPWRTPEGAVGGIVIFTEDITYRKEAQEVLERYELLANHSRDIILFMDQKNGRILEANAAAKTAYGYSRAELLKLTIQDLRAADMRSLTAEQMQIASSQGILFETVHQRRDGSLFPVEVSSQGAFTGGRQTLISVIRDITARKQDEEALREKMLEYGAIFERSIVGKAQADPATGRFLEVNQSLAGMTGYSRAELCRMTFMDITHPDDRERDVQGFEPVREGLADQWQIEKRYVRKDGTIIWVYVAGHLLRFEDGKPARTIALIQDITERKIAEQALRNSEKNLKASLAEKEVLLKEIHHRVKNNMQVISSLIDLQAEEVKNNATREIFKDVTHRVHSMAMVHEKLYQSGDFAHVDFADYARSLLGYLWHSQKAAAPAVELKLDLEPVLLPVNEAVPCGLILNELITNALKHAFVGCNNGTVTVSLKTNALGKVSLAVQDDGIGLPLGMDIEKARSLGLRLVQMLTRQLHGSVETEACEGTKFTITFEVLNHEPA